MGVSRSVFGTAARWLRRVFRVEPRKDAPGREAAERLRRQAERNLDLLKSGPGGGLGGAGAGLDWTPSEIARLGRDLESLGDPLRAAEAFALSGDAEGELRALSEAGAIERLEATFDDRHHRERKEALSSELYGRIQDLRRIGRPRRAAELAARFAKKEGRFERALREIELLRVRGAIVELEIDGAPVRVALGDTVTIGRDGATLSVGSPAVSRVHLELRRDADGPLVVDHSKNGTTLRGARVERLRIGAGFELVLGGQVPVTLSPSTRSGVVIRLAGELFEAPLGPFVVGGLSVRPGHEEWIELDAASGNVILGELEVATPIELSRDDAVRERRDGPVRLRVLS